MATVRQLQKRIEQAEARTSEPEVIYQLKLTGDEPMQELSPGQRLVVMTSLGVAGRAEWQEVARG